jgi:GT2 family glycosyltransferase
VKKRIFVVTVTWNGLQDTCECLDSLFLQEDVLLDIVVVDNGSTDGATQFLRKKYPNVETIRSERNLGFAGGFNLGITYAIKQGAEYVLIINNDTILDSSMCKNLLFAMSDEVAVASPVIFYAQDPQRIWSAGGYIHPNLLEPRDSHSRDQELPSVPIKRTFLSGCCMLIKRDVFTKIGLFDERFFVYYEDLDFCLRLLQNKLTIVLVPSAKLWHKVSLSSGGELSPSERYFMAYSSCLYFHKHLSLKTIPMIIPYRVGSAILWTFRLIIKKNWKSLRAYWRGIWRGILS